MGSILMLQGLCARWNSESISKAQGFSFWVRAEPRAPRSSDSRTRSRCLHPEPDGWPGAEAGQAIESQGDQPHTAQEAGVRCDRQCDSAGMEGNRDPLPLSEQEFKARYFFEMVYTPRRDQDGQDGPRQGMHVILGSEMFVQQGARQFEIWSGKPAPLHEMQRGGGFCPGPACARKKRERKQRRRKRPQIGNPTSAAFSCNGAGLPLHISNCPRTLLHEHFRSQDHVHALGAGHLDILVSAGV